MSGSKKIAEHLFRILIRLKDEETIYTIVCDMFHDVYTRTKE